MKTSNKLLILLLVLIFAIPLILLMSFKSAIKADRYIVKNSMGDKVTVPKAIKRFTAISLNGIPSDNNFGLKAYIRYGDKFSYSIRNYDENNPEEGRTDSCSIRLVGDTLLVDYSIKPVKENSTNYFYGVEVDIILPRAVPVTARAATIIIDSSAIALGAARFELANNATLNIANMKVARDAEENQMKMPAPVIIFPVMDIKADNSNVKVDDHINIKNLNLELTGRSTVNFREAVSIDTISGHISNESIFNAPYRYSKFLK